MADRIPLAERTSFERIHAVVGGDPMLVRLAAEHLKADATDEEIRTAHKRAADELDREEYRRLWRCP